MILLADICLWFCLGCVSFQDLKQRRISWFLIPLLLIGFVAKGLLLSAAPEKLLYDSLINLGFITFQLVLLSGYISIKKKRFVNIINTYLGIGDILFFVVICSAFSPLNFIVFYIISLIITLISVILYSLLTKKETGEIPLAGVMAIVMSLVLVLFNFTSYSPYNNDWLLNIIQA